MICHFPPHPGRTFAFAQQSLVTVMPILNLIKGSPELSLAPEEIESLVEASKASLLALGIADRNDPAAIWVAEQILAVARLGERDPFQIHKLVAASFRTGSKSKSIGL